MGAIKVLIGSLTGGGGNSNADPLAFYPVGAIFQSFDPTSPEILFGGKWEQITGRFLRAANDTQTGGSDTVTLTANQIPSHNHNNTKFPLGYGVGSLSASGGSPALFAASSSTTTTLTTANTGGGQAHNNMPAYQDVYTWRRTE